MATKICFWQIVQDDFPSVAGKRWIKAWVPVNHENHCLLPILHYKTDNRNVAEKLQLPPGIDIFSNRLLKVLIGILYLKWKVRIWSRHHFIEPFYFNIQYYITCCKNMKSEPGKFIDEIWDIFDLTICGWELGPHGQLTPILLALLSPFRMNVRRWEPGEIMPK